MFLLHYMNILPSSHSLCFLLLTTTSWWTFFVDWNPKMTKKPPRWFQFVFTGKTTLTRVSWCLPASQISVKGVSLFLPKKKEITSNTFSEPSLNLFAFAKVWFHKCQNIYFQPNRIYIQQQFCINNSCNHFRNSLWGLTSEPIRLIVKIKIPLIHSIHCIQWIIVHFMTLMTYFKLFNFVF